MPDKLCLLLDLDGVLVDVQGNDDSLVASSEYNIEWESRALQFYKEHTRLLPGIEVMFNGLRELIDGGVVDVFLWTYSLGPRALVLGKWLREEYLSGRPLPVIHRECGDWNRNELIHQRWGGIIQPSIDNSTQIRHYVKNPQMLHRMPAQWLDQHGVLCMGELTVRCSSTLQVDDQPGRLRKSPHGVVVPPIFNSHGVASKLLACIREIALHYQQRGGDYAVSNSLRTSSHLSQTVYRYFQTSECDAGTCSDYTDCGSGHVENAPGYKSELFVVYTLRT